MKDMRTLKLGIDLSDLLTQISCYDEEAKEPVPVGYRYAGKEIYEIPSVLSFDTHHKIWYFGVEAEERKHDSGFITIRNLLSLARTEDSISVSGMSFEISELLRIFIIRLLNIVKTRYPYQKILYCAFTCTSADDVMLSKLSKSVLEAGLDSERFSIVSHPISYMHYATSQKVELWLNNIGLFEFYRDDDLQIRLKFIQLTIDRSSNPFIVSWNERDLTDNLDLKKYETMTEHEKVTSFTSMANAIFYKHNITTVYIIGSKIVSGWIDQSLRKLCVGRRIFKGENLYTRGACYLAHEIMAENHRTDIVLMDSTGIDSNIYLRVYTDAQIQLLKVVSAGSKWEHIDESVDIIPDEEDEICIVIENVLTRQKRYHMLSLNNVEKRPDKMTRFTFRIRFKNVNECIITLKDRGFGDFYRSTNRIWERTLKL